MNYFGKPNRIRVDLKRKMSQVAKGKFINECIKQTIQLIKIQFVTSTKSLGDRGSSVVKVLRYKSEGRCFDPRWCHGIFH
jgi:hypothetical protein